jgi:hypothetical protein
VNARWRQISRALLVLPFRPDRLAHAAIVTPAPLCAVLGAVTWTLALTLPLLGGGIHMPYSTWGHHLQDTLAFAPVLLLVVAPIAVPLVLLIGGSAGGDDEGDVLARTVVLSAIPWIAPLVLRLPFQVCARASVQVFPAPRFPPGFVEAGSDIVLWPLAALWLAFLARALFAVRRTARRVGLGLCHRCGYDLIDLTVCPECGAERSL